MTKKKAPQKTARQLLSEQNTPESRFMLAGLKLRDSRGGAPHATYENGQFVFTYPDGTRTIGGKVV